jgi:acetyl-CoA carboxylase biotin carboxylase subunit
MNTRLQVEHPITEMVTGIDLVEWQLRIARGEPLDVDPVLAHTPDGHAIECRVYAEDPDVGFMPSPGRIAALRAAAGPWVRDDGGVESGGEVPIYYDPLISKLSAWGPDRPRAIARMTRALREYEVLGIQTTVPFFRWLLAQPAFLAAKFHTGYLDELLQHRGGEPFATANREEEEAAIVGAVLHLMSREAHPTHASSSVGVPIETMTSRDAFTRTRGGWKALARTEALRT